MPGLFGGGGSQPAGNTTSTQVSQPWSGQAPYLSEQLQGAENLYHSPGPQYYPASTYAPLTQMQQDIAGQIENAGMNSQNMPRANWAVGTLLNNGTNATQGAFGAGQNALQNELSPGFTSGANTIYSATNMPLWNTLQSSFTDPSKTIYSATNMPLWNTLQSAFTQPSQNTFGNANSMLANELSPDYLNPWNSPSFQTVVNNTLANVLPATTAGFVNGNRAGSGLAQRAATMAATDAVGNLAQNQYNQNQQIQQNAAQQAANNYATMLGLQQNAGQQAASNYQNLLGLQQNAGQQAANNYLNLLGVQNNAAGLASNNFLNQQNNILKGSALLPSFDQQTLNNMQAALGAAGLGQQNQQNIINSDVNRWNYYQNLPYQQLANFANMIGGNYGGTTNLSQPYYQNQGANFMSGLTGTLGLANAGAQAAGYSSLIPMIASISDRRLKTGIKQIGRAANGLPIYRFRFLGDDVQHVGLMAQDVAVVRPEAVHELPGGVLAVNYEKALAA